MVSAFNADCMSVVPAKGTVGASGDLAPLSHLALGLMGEGSMWDPDTATIGASEIDTRTYVRAAQMATLTLIRKIEPV